MISIIIVNYNGKEHLINCLKSIYNITQDIKYEIILVDNCSTDGSIEAIQQSFPGVIILSQTKNHGFGKANNIGAKQANGDLLFFVNNDTIFTQNILKELEQYIIKNQTIGALAPLLLNKDLSIQLSYSKYPSLINEFITKRKMKYRLPATADLTIKEVDWVSFAAVMIRREVFEKINGFDERYFMYFEDIDFCFRLRQCGYKIIFYPRCSLFHLCGGSMSLEITKKIRHEYRRSQLLFYSLYRSKFELLLLRIYLILKFSIGFLFNRGEARENAYSIIKLALSS